MPRRNATSALKSFEERDREIGAILADARQQGNRTVTECADIAATTRRRYSMIERGEAAVSASELEALIRFLNISPHLVWPDLAPFSQTHQLVLRAKPGEKVHLVVEVREPTS